MHSTGKKVLGVAGFAAVVVGAVAVAMAAAQDSATEYSGTFSDASGRKGPMQCMVTPEEGAKWALKFSGKNEGQGPNRPYECAFDLPGKKDGTILNLSGTTDVVRIGQHAVTITVTDKTLEGTFKKTDGKNSGSFSMTAAQSTL